MERIEQHAKGSLVDDVLALRTRQLLQLRGSCIFAGLVVLQYDS
jgi:hypothetical protein